MVVAEGMRDEEAKIFQGGQFKKLFNKKWIKSIFLHHVPLKFQA